ncbi:MAG: class I mannose-6-phosphate isomerase [Salinivirgaceae bacterium]|nr:class I mannose-6-phosphate isomerase [Salinivirgaceae bacterium]
MKNKEMGFEKYPTIEVRGEEKSCYLGWKAIGKEIENALSNSINGKKTVVIECYQGVDFNELLTWVKEHLSYTNLVLAENTMLSEDSIKTLTQQDVTDDRIFGYLTRLNMIDFFDKDKLEKAKNNIETTTEGTTIIFGYGASLFVENPDILIYADMARWEIQQRMRRNEISNLGISNNEEKVETQYKRAFFVDWRVCDRLKKKLMHKWDYVLDTNQKGFPKLATGQAVLKGLKQATKQPFSVVPFFDAGPWGGQWMKEVCDLDKTQENFAWCFNCIPEENSLLLQFGDILFEIPSINLVFYQAKELLGEAVYGRFGDEFPIRFDFLDTIGGGNLSLQVHPVTEYIQEKFGIPYTQDESYYIMDTKPGAEVYLGLKEGIKPQEMIRDLEEAEKNNSFFDADKHVNIWNAKKHDHFLIPAGTVHCSGKDSMVLEISSTPYIFTFKLWDWGRVGMDGKPRPINVEHGKQVIQWDRTTEWTKNNLINQFETISQGEGWREEKTGLHAQEFIETRRHWFTKKVNHNTHNGVNVLCLIDGDEAIIESPNGTFEPFVVHYAETFIVPATVGEYSIRPYGISEGKEIATIKAFIRTNS